MAISDLSSEERVQLFEKYKELNSIVKQKEELDTKMIPLCDKLEELNAEEKSLNKEYDEILLINKEGFTSEDTSRLTDIISRYVEISNEKGTIKQEIMNLSDDFFNIRKEEDIIREYIDVIVEKKQGSTFSNNDDIVYLDKKGNVINKVVVNSSDFSRVISGEDQHINSIKNTITKTSKKVINVIKENYKVKNFIFNIESDIKYKITKFVQSVKSVEKELLGEIKKGYYEEEERVQSIIDNYNKVKNEKEKIEEEAENLEYFNNNQTIDNKLPDNMNRLDEKTNNPESKYMEETNSSDAISDALVELPTNLTEEREVETPNLDEVVNTIDNSVSDSVDDVKDEKSADDIDKESNVIVESYLESDQFVKQKNDKVAKTNKSKLTDMVSLFDWAKNQAMFLGKVIASISTNKKLRSEKINALRELDDQNKQELNNISDEYKAKRDKLEELKQQKIQEAQNAYNSQVDEIENIFADRSMVA